MGIGSSSFLEVIDKVNVKGVSVFKAKDDPPVAGYRHAPITLGGSFQP
jgi:hypothetical protein